MSLADSVNKSGVTVFDGAMLVEAALLKSVADLSAFLDRIQGCARVVWPHVVFPGEDGFDEEEAEAEGAPVIPVDVEAMAAELSAVADDPAMRPGRAVFVGGAPPPGSMSEQVLAASRKLKTEFALPIANHLGMKPVAVGICLGKLKRAGLLA